MNDPELNAAIRGMKEATGNPARVRETPEGAVVFDFSTPARRTVEAATAHGGMSRAARRAAKKSTRKRGRGWTK